MNKKQISFYIDASLAKRFKKKCVSNDMTMKQVISELIRAYLEGKK